MTDKPTPKEIDDLVYELRQAGKDDTYSIARAVLAKWGTLAQETKGRKVFVCTNCDGVYADQPVTQCDCLPDENTFTEGWICFGAQAQAAEPVAWAFKYDDGTWHDPSTTEHSPGTRPLCAAPQPVARATASPTQPAPATQQAGEVGEVAEHYRNAIASACEGWTMPDGLRKHLETALWSPPTPQPTQPQPVARVPAVDEARRLFNAGWKACANFCDRDDVVADGIIGFGACPQFEAAFSAAQPVAREPLTDEQIKALMQAHRAAMLMTCKARVPECGEFSAIAQDLDWLCESFGIKGGQHGTE